MIRTRTTDDGVSPTVKTLDATDESVTEDRSCLLAEHQARPGATQVKICFMASGGGHFQELCGLADLAQKYDHILISTEVNKALAHACPFQHTYQIDEVGLGLWKNSPLRILGTFRQVLRILRRERPNLVVSTGAGIAVPGFLAAKLLGVRTIYIESSARVQSLSLAGRVCYHLADRFLVQHACLAGRLPRAVYAGSLNSFLDADSHETEDPQGGEGRP